MSKKEMNDQELAQAMIKAVYDDQEMEINGRTYAFLKMVHKKRRKVFSFMSRVQGLIATGDFSFMDWPEFDLVEKAIHDSITFDGSLISKLADHWEEHPEDYINFTITALSVISYPFLAGSRTA